MNSSTTNRYVRRAAMAVGTTLVGSMALVGPAATPAQAAVLPLSCTVSFAGLPSDGIPVIGSTLTPIVTIGGGNDLLNVQLPILSAVVSVPAGTSTIPGVPTSPIPLPFTVSPADVGNQLAGLGQIGSVLPTSVLGQLLTTLGLPALTSPINCTTAVTPPVVSPPGGPGGAGSSTTLGATPVGSAPRVVGKVKVRKTVRADVGAVAAGTTVTYQWFKKKNKRAPRAIAGATGATYKIKKGIRGKRLFVVATYTKAGYSPSVVGSQARRVR